jgi:hypothetical protein
MSNRIALTAAALLAVSTSAALAATYHISITGACDQDTITLKNGFVYGRSTVNDCDNSNLVGVRAKLPMKVGVGGTVLIAGGDFGLAPDAWTWAFNIATQTATLVGTTDGKTYVTANFSFTYTKDGAYFHPTHNNGLPSARAIALAALKK